MTTRSYAMVAVLAAATLGVGTLAPISAGAGPAGTSQQCRHRPVGPGCHATLLTATAMRHPHSLRVAVVVRPRTVRTVLLQLRGSDGSWQSIAVDHTDGNGHAGIVAGFPPAYQRLTLRVRIAATLHHASNVTQPFHWRPHPTKLHRVCTLPTDAALTAPSPAACQPVLPNRPIYDKPARSGITEMSIDWRSRLQQLINADRRSHGRPALQWDACESGPANSWAQHLAHAHQLASGHIPNCATSGQAVGKAIGGIYPAQDGNARITPDAVFGALLRDPTNRRLIREQTPASAIGIGAWWAPRRGSDKPLLAVVVNIGNPLVAPA